MVRIRAAAALAAVALAATACGNSRAGAGVDVFHPKPKAPATHSLAITFDLYAADVAATGCLTGDTGYVDLGPGTPIVVEDESHHVIGTGALGSPTLADETTCEWNEEVNDIPTNRSTYAVQIGSRGWIYSTRSQLVANDWTVSMHLGG